VKPHKFSHTHECMMTGWVLCVSYIREVGFEGINDTGRYCMTESGLMWCDMKTMKKLRVSRVRVHGEEWSLQNERKDCR